MDCGCERGGPVCSHAFVRSDCHESALAHVDVVVSGHVNWRLRMLYAHTPKRAIDWVLLPVRLLGYDRRVTHQVPQM